MGFYELYLFGVVLMACEFGQYVSNAFEGIDDEIEAFDWYLFPHELQRMLPMVLVIVQRPVELNLFGSISPLRKYFQKASFNSEQLII